MADHLPSNYFYETLTSYIIYGTIKKRPSLIENQELRFVQRINLPYIMVGQVLPTSFNPPQFSLLAQYWYLYHHSIELYDDRLVLLFTYTHLDSIGTAILTFHNSEYFMINCGNFLPIISSRFMISIKRE